MKEWWSARWYVPLVVMTLGVFTLVAVALLGVEALTAGVPRAVAPRLWTTPLARLEQALGEDDSAGAMSWWHEARAAALRSGQWEGMIEVGDAARRFPEGDALARQAYLTALVRARQQRSLDGVLRAAAAFGELGDREVLAQALRMAEREAGLDPRARERVSRVAERWLRPPLRSERSDPWNPGGTTQP